MLYSSYMWFFFVVSDLHAGIRRVIFIAVLGRMFGIILAVDKCWSKNFENQQSRAAIY